MLIDLVFENTRIFGLLDPTNNFGHLMLVAPGWHQGVCCHPSLNQPLSGDYQMISRDLNRDSWSHYDAFIAILIMFLTYARPS